MSIHSDVGFVFSTKERLGFSPRSLESIDTCGGFDLVWVDGSSSAEAKAFPHEVRLRNCHIAEIYENITGGPDRVIRFGLGRLLDLGYAYCGLIENDIAFESGWFPNLMELFRLGQRDGLRVGAATARTIESRVLCWTSEYAVMWLMGAAMALFTREAAQIVLSTYRSRSARTLASFYRKRFGADLTGAWELLMGHTDRTLGCDWSYAMDLYRQGLCSLGTIPSLARNFDRDVEADFRTSYAVASMTPTARDKETFARLLLATSKGGVAARLERKAALLVDSRRSTLAFALARHNNVRRLLHPLSSAKALSSRLAKSLRSSGA